MDEPDSRHQVRGDSLASDSACFGCVILSWSPPIRNEGFGTGGGTWLARSNPIDGHLLSAPCRSTACSDATAWREAKSAGATSRTYWAPKSWWVREHAPSTAPKHALKPVPERAPRLKVRQTQIPSLFDGSRMQQRRSSAGDRASGARVYQRASVSLPVDLSRHSATLPGRAAERSHSLPHTRAHAERALRAKGNISALMRPLIDGKKLTMASASTDETERRIGLAVFFSACRSGTVPMVAKRPKHSIRTTPANAVRQRAESGWKQHVDEERRGHRHCWRSWHSCPPRSPGYFRIYAVNV